MLVAITSNNTARARQQSHPKDMRPYFKRGAQEKKQNENKNMKEY
jgi:hypothetical protein